MSEERMNAGGDNCQTSSDRDDSTTYLSNVIASAEQELKEYSEKFTEKIQQIETHIHKVEETIDYLIAELMTKTPIEDMTVHDNPDPAITVPDSGVSHFDAINALP